METLGSRIRNRRKQLKLTQKDIAKAVGVSSSSVTQWEADISIPKSDNARALCEILRTNWQWIRTGHGSANDTEPPLQTNTHPVPSIGHCPLINKVQAGAWTETVDIYEPGYAEDWLPCPVKHGKHTYVLQVEGESMLNPGNGRSFRSGDFIFVDPEKQPENGSLVIVQREIDKEATFKQLIIEGGSMYLKALNPSWPEKIIEIDATAKICGVVICKVEPI